MFRKFVVACAVLSAAVLAPVSSTFADDLTLAEIQDEIVGRHLVWWEDGGWQAGGLMLGPNGSAEISIEQPRPRADIGRWEFRGGELCTTWSSIRSGMKKCYSVRRGELGRFVTSGGNIFEIREAGV